MQIEYPEVITELIVAAKLGKLRRFNLSSFMSSKPIDDMFKKIDKSMRFFSVYVLIERLEEDLWKTTVTQRKKKFNCAH